MEDDEHKHNKAKGCKTYANVNEVIRHKVVLNNAIVGKENVFLCIAPVATHAKPNERIRSYNQNKKDYKPRRQLGTSNMSVFMFTW